MKIKYTLNNLKVSLIVAVLAWGLSSSTHLQGAPLFDVDFSGDAVSQPPSVKATPTAGEVATKPTSVSIGGGGTSGSILVAEDYQAGTATLSGKSAVMSTEGRSIQINLRGNAADFEAGQDFSLSFDTLVNGSVGNLTINTLRVNFYNETFAAAGYQASLVFTGNGGLYLQSGSNNATFTNQWAANEILSFQLNVLYSTEVFQVILNGGTPLEISLAASGDTEAQKGVGGFQFQQGQANSYFELAVSNIKTEAIPEPSVVMLVCFAGLLLFHRRFFKFES